MARPPTPAPAKQYDGKVLRDGERALTVTLPHPFRWIHMCAVGWYRIAQTALAERFHALDAAGELVGRHRDQEFVICDAALAALGIAGI